MNTSKVMFDQSMIAPCGMNCGTCIGFLRDKNRCDGCRSDSVIKANHCKVCSVKNCENLTRTKSFFCFECDLFPCSRIKQLDKRYRTKYRTSFILNLTTIRETGIEKFLKTEINKWTCPGCGSTLSCHRDKCLTCKQDQVSQI